MGTLDRQFPPPDDFRFLGSWLWDNKNVILNRRYLKVSIRSLFAVAWWRECDLVLESVQCRHVITFCGRTVTRTRNCIDVTITSLCNNFFGFQVMRIQHCLDVASKSPCDNFLWSHDNENSTKSKPWCNHFLWLHGYENATLHRRRLKVAMR